MRSHGRSGLCFLISLAAVVLAGCNGASPTEPTAFTPIGQVSGSLTGEAVVSGQLVQGGSALSSSSALSSGSIAAAGSGLGNVQVPAGVTEVIVRASDNAHKAGKETFTVKLPPRR